MECCRKAIKPLDVKRWLLLLATLGVLSNVAEPCEPATGEPAAEVIDEFDVAKGGDVLILPVAIAGKEYPFLLNVACPRTIVDERLRPILANPTGQVDDTVNSRKYDEIPAIPMKIGSQSFTPAKSLLCVDLRDLREQLGRETYGIVGLDFLEGRIIDIDFDHGKLRVLSSFPYSELPLEATFEPLIRTIFDASCYSVHFNLPGSARVGYFKIDTLSPLSVGAGPHLMNTLVRDGVVSGSQQAVELQSGAIRPAKHRFGLLDWIKLSEWTHRKLFVVEVDSNCVGLRYLSRYRLTFNFRKDPTKYVYFTPGARFHDRELCHNWNGIVLLLKHGKVTIDMVFPGTLAAKAGIQIGDVLVQMDGQNVEKFSLFEIRRTLMEQNLVHLKIQRPGQDPSAPLEFTAALKNPNPIPPVARPGTDPKEEELK